MSVVVYGSCPDCGRSVAGGALSYSYTANTPPWDVKTPGDRVVACTCGSKKRPR